MMHPSTASWQVCDEAWRRELEAAVIDSVRREGAAGLNGYPLLDVLMLSGIATPFVGRDVVDCILRELPASSPTPAILRSAIKRVVDVYEQHGYVPDRRDVEWLWSMDLLSDIARFKPYSRLALGLRYFPYPVPAHVLSQLVKALEDAPHDEVVPRSRFVNGILAACNKGGTEEHRAVTRSLLDALWSYWAAQPVEQGGGEAAAEGARGEGGSSDRLADGEGGTAAASTGLAAAEDGGGGSSTGRRSVGGEGERGSASSLSWDEQGPEAAVFREDRRVGGKKVHIRWPETGQQGHPRSLGELLEVICVSSVFVEYMGSLVPWYPKGNKVRSEEVPAVPTSAHSFQP